MKDSIWQNASELESSLFGLFRASHLPYKAKSDKGSTFFIDFYCSLFSPIPTVWGWPFKGWLPKSLYADFTISQVDQVDRGVYRLRVS